MTHLAHTADKRPPMNWKNSLHCAYLLTFVCSHTQAASLSGQINVLKKDATTPLTHFDHTLVYLQGISTPPPKTPAIHRQKNKQFFPRVLPIVKGQRVQFWNEDTVQHNVFSTDAPTPFDLDRYPKGQQRSVRFDQLGQQHIYCNIHKTMIGNIRILDNHYYALTDQAGRYTIPDIPPGDYTLHLEHIYGGQHQHPMSMAQEDMTFDKTLISTKVIRDLESHKNKYGQQYETKSAYDSEYDYEEDAF